MPAVPGGVLGGPSQKYSGIVDLRALQVLLAEVVGLSEKLKAVEKAVSEGPPAVAWSGAMTAGTGSGAVVASFSITVPVAANYIIVSSASGFQTVAAGLMGIRLSIGGTFLDSLNNQWQHLLFFNALSSHQVLGNLIAFPVKLPSGEVAMKYVLSSNAGSPNTDTNDHFAGFAVVA